MGTGQCNVKVRSLPPLSFTPSHHNDLPLSVQSYNRYLRDLIIAGRAKPNFVVSHNVSLDEAADAYTKFDKRIDGYTKVLLHP